MYGMWAIGCPKQMLGFSSSWRSLSNIKYICWRRAAKKFGRRIDRGRPQIFSTLHLILCPHWYESRRYHHYMNDCTTSSARTTVETDLRRIEQEPPTTTGPQSHLVTMKSLLSLNVSQLVLLLPSLLRDIQMFLGIPSIHFKISTIQRTLLPMLLAKVPLHADHKIFRRQVRRCR